MHGRRRQLWHDPHFQIPLILLVGCLILALLFSVVGLGRPNVAVVLSLDLSGSTFNNNINTFNQPGTIVAQEVTAAKDYILKNNEVLRQPNYIMIHGFGRNVVYLTPQFHTNPDVLISQLDQALSRADLLPQVDPDGTNLTGAIAAATDQLRQVPNRCRELLLVTDGEAAIDPAVITEAKEHRVKINAIVIGSRAPELESAVLQTGGHYQGGEVNRLNEFVVTDFFERFNTNYRWLIFWLGLAWICLMWVWVMPLDRWLLQGLFQLPMNLSGKIAVFHAVTWTVITPLILWRFPGWPFLGYC